LTRARTLHFEGYITRTKEKKRWITIPMESFQRLETGICKAVGWHKAKARGSMLGLSEGQILTNKKGEQSVTMPLMPNFSRIQDVATRFNVALIRYEDPK
jgi:hypothetical protein